MEDKRMNGSIDAPRANKNHSTSSSVEVWVSIRGHIEVNDIDWIETNLQNIVYGSRDSE